MRQLWGVPGETVVGALTGIDFGVYSSGRKRKKVYWLYNLVI